MSNKCTIFKNTFFGDLAPYHIPDTSGIVYNGTDRRALNYNVNLSSLASESQDYWQPIFIKNENFIENKAILGKTPITNKILGIENAITFEPVFKNWNIQATPSNSGIMSCNWFVSSMAGGIHPEYGVLCWYKNRTTASSGNIDSIPLKSLPSNLLGVAVNDIVDSNDNSIVLIKSGSVVTKLSDTVVIDHSKSRYRFISRTVTNNNDEEEYINEMQHTDASAFVTVDAESKFSLMTTGDIVIGGQTVDIWLADGEAFSYYNNPIEKQRYNTSNIASYSYLSPGLFPIYREIYHSITRPYFRNSALSRKHSMALQKLCYFLSTGPLVDRITVDLLSTQSAQTLISEYLNADMSDTDTEQTKLLDTIKGLMALYAEMHRTPYRKTVNNNCISSTKALITKLLSKYGAVVNIKPNNNAVLTHKNNISTHSIISLGYFNHYQKNTTSDTALYNNFAIKLGNLEYASALAASSGIFNINQYGPDGAVKHTGVVPLADAVLPQIKYSDLYAGGVMNFTWAPGATSVGTVSETVIDHDRWVAGGAQLGDGTFLWESYGGNACVKFRDSSKDLNIFGRPIYPPQKRFDTTISDAPMVFLGQSGSYDLKVTRTLYGSLVQSDIATVTSVASDLQNITPTINNYTLSKVMCNGVKTIAFHKLGMLWLVDTDHYRDEGRGTDMDDYGIFGVVRLKDAKLTVAGKWDMTSNSDIGELKIKFTGGNAGCWLVSIDIEHMRDGSEATKNCKSFYREKIARITRSTQLILGSSDFARVSPGSYEFSARSCGIVGIPDVTFGEPNISTVLSPALYTYGGYDKSIVDTIGVRMPFHPEPSNDCSPSIPSSPQRNDFALRTPRKYCFPEDVNNIEHSYITMKTGHFHPNAGWVPNENCDCTRQESSGGVNLKVSYKLLSSATAGEDVLHIEMLDNEEQEVKKYDVVVNNPSQPTTSPIQYDTYIVSVLSDGEGRYYITLSQPISADMSIDDQLTIVTVETRSVRVCKWPGYIKFKYDAYSVPDRFKIIGIQDGAEDQTLFDTKFRGDDPCGYIQDVEDIGQGSEEIFKPFGITSILLVVEAPCDGTAWEFSMSCPNLLGKTAVVADRPDKQQCITFKGGGFYNMRPGASYGSRIYLTSLGDVDTKINNNYGVGGVDSSNWGNYTSRTFREGVSDPWFSSGTSDIVDITNICGQQYTEYAAQPSMIDKIIKNIEVKLNFLNYFNPKNLKIWLDISGYNAQNQPINKSIPLLNQEHIDNYNSNFVVTFSDYADKFVVPHKYYNSNNKIAHHQKVVNHNGKMLSSTFSDFQNDFQAEDSSYGARLGQVPFDSSFVYKFSSIGGLKVNGAQFKLNIRLVNYLVNDGRVMDNLFHNDQMAGNTLTANLPISNTSLNSLCSWEVLAHFTDLKNPVSLDYANSVDYSLSNQDSYIPKYNPYTGYDYIGDFTDKKYMIPLVNINAPYQSLANINSCSYINEELGRNVYVPKAEFPSLLPYMTAGLGFAFGSIVGGMVALYALNSFLGNGGRNDPIVNYFIETRLLNQTETTNGQYYKPVYNKQYFGQADRAIVCLSENGAYWYAVEVPIFKLSNTPAVQRKVYNYTKPTGALYDLPYTVVTDIAQLNLKDQPSFTITTDNKTIAINGVRPGYLFQVNELVGLTDQSNTLAGNTAITDISVVSTSTGQTSLIKLSDAVTNDKGFLRKLQQDTILIYATGLAGVVDNSFHLPRWLSEKTLQELTVDPWPIKHISAYSPGSIGWGTTQVAPEMLYKNSHNTGNIPLSELLDHKKNNTPINNKLLFINKNNNASIVVTTTGSFNAKGEPTDPNIAIQGLSAWTTTPDDFGYLYHDGTPVSTGTHTFEDKSSPLFIELKGACIANTGIFKMGKLIIENDFTVIRDSSDIRDNRYWITLQSGQPYILADELTVRIPTRVDVRALPITDSAVEQNQIFPPSTVSITGELSDRHLQSGNGSYVWTVPSGLIEQQKAAIVEKYGINWTRDETFVYGNSDPASGDSKKLLIASLDLSKDNLVAIKETYIRPSGTFNNKYGKLGDVIQLGGSDLRLKFRNIPRQLKSVDSEIFDKYIYDRRGNISKGIGATSRARSVDQIANNFVCWKCIDENGKFVEPDPFFKAMNEMHYRAFFGSMDKIEHKGAFSDSQDAWEWIPYEFFTNNSTLSWNQNLTTITTIPSSILLGSLKGIDSTSVINIQHSIAEGAALSIEIMDANTCSPTVLFNSGSLEGEGLINSTLSIPAGGRKDLLVFIDINSDNSSQVDQNAISSISVYLS